MNTVWQLLTIIIVILVMAFSGPIQDDAGDVLASHKREAERSPAADPDLPAPTQAGDRPRRAGSDR